VTAAARLLAPALALAALAAFLTPTPAATADTGGTTPLSVHIDSLSRATLPRHGRLVVTGTVTNESSEVWQGINVDPLTSYSPITSRRALARAAATPEDTYLGERLTAPGTYARIGDLAPGDSAGFRLSLPARALQISGQPGVYWFAVHALGADAQGRDNYADGRARTFLPLLPPHASRLQAQADLVLPLRVPVRRDPTGALLDSSTWTTELAPGGLLDRELRFAESAHGQPLTWLVDPAVLQAADDVAHGNPPLSYGEPAAPGLSPSPSPSPSASATPSQPAVGDPDSGRPVVNATAADWLSRLEGAMAGQNVLGLPFADPDVAALARRGQRLLHHARSLADAVFADFGITDLPAVAPADGVLPDAALGHLQPGDILLLSDRGKDLRRSTWLTDTGQQLMFTDERAASGGPGPTPSLDALALRQRIVADAALRAMEHATGPMLVVLPTGWDPGSAWQQADFFGGLAGLSWLRLSSVSPDAGDPVYRHRLAYPRSAARDQLREPNIAAARRLVADGQTLASALATANDVGARVTGAALAAVSYHARQAPQVARQQVAAFDQSIDTTLSGISVTGTDFVTLSGRSGSLTVSLVNGLKVPVTVGIAAHSDSRAVKVVTPSPVQIAAGQRTTMRLDASSRTVGVHEITLTPVTTNGQRLGTPLVFSLRTSDVGRWIWLVLAAGGALLAFAIGRRLVLRVRPRGRGAA
jgi:hypothetical protein